MKRATRILALAAVVTAGVPATATPAAAAPQPGVLWSGKTEQGGRVFLRTVRRGGVREVTYFQADVTLTCEGTGEALELTFGALPDAPVTDGWFRYDQVIFNTAFHVSGTLGPQDGYGLAHVAIAAFTPEEETQRCSSGSVAWKVHRRATSSETSGLRLRVDAAHGEVTISDRSSAARTGAGEPIRPWFGETAQRFPLFFETIGRPGSRRIGTYDIGAFAPCLSSDFAVALQILGYADLPLDHGAWRIDEVGLFAAVHWAGAVANSEAHGTLEMSLPAFAPDESIEVCTSDVVPWRATPGPIVGHTSGGSPSELVRVTAG